MGWDWVKSVLHQRTDNLFTRSGIQELFGNSQHSPDDQLKHVNVDELDGIPEFTTADSYCLREDDLTDGASFLSRDLEYDALRVWVL